MKAITHLAGKLMAIILLLAACSHAKMNTQNDLNHDAVQAKHKAHSAMVAAEGGNSFAKQEFTQMLQKAAQSFCQGTYLESCDGSVCQMCAQGCEEALYNWRRDHLKALANRELSLAKPAKLRIKNLEVFSDYAKALCDTVDSGWKGGTKPEDCAARALSHLDHQVLKSLISLPENEGDVCAQLSPVE